ncbi:Cobyrinic acid ac-diamide synthase (plasmid) [Deinococcus proteolyticus MRP]|uniref:Cobyrinic acid ac-diamide synthase n=1 Tax=Deinococcus proteolyticus (strain ATCC 35074 / DSM 20540 / JCM 6276 / NBRC 101906 / NCIMB 13154 / VKM Ac-1939 / CCM 2703 / MRP) TaxID=693977 RepID=F0RQV3_DEIPM|nr:MULTISPECIES: ParA family protein [Deinococcus]ADY27662.1 Cobyrinic acid ac-diamide synthase [Deinococcus proteolyticus MRP]MCY1703540.1 ParA family protein [Deinococcus sp. SL84]
MTGQTRVILMFIHAGGAGKTSTTRDLGAELARRGKRVLLIDLDPQANLTTWLGVYDAEPAQTVQGALMDYAPLPEPLRVHGMDLIPSHLSLARTERILGGLTNSEGRLQLAIDALREGDRYDYILLDCPPSLGRITSNAANSADWVVVPIQAALKGLNALDGVQETITEHSRTNRGLKVAMYLVTQMNNTRVAHEMMDAFREILGDRLAGPMTSRPAVYGKAQTEGRPIGTDRADADALREIAAATDTLLQRVGDQA